MHATLLCFQASKHPTRPPNPSSEYPPNPPTHPPTHPLQVLERMDVFTKFHDEDKVQTSRGSTISLLSWVLVLVLFCSEAFEAFFVSKEGWVGGVGGWMDGLFLWLSSALLDVMGGGVGG